MLTIITYLNKSERNRVAKVLEQISSMTGTLRQETSIIDPAFLIYADLDDFIECNYLDVPAFGRKYFVNNIRSIRTGLIELTCHVDVISSFATQIKANSAIVKKQENNWNLYLNDGSFRVYQNPIVLTKAFPSGFTTQEFVLAVAGR